jgi:hypothetical protein
MTEKIDRVGVITPAQRWRRWSAEEKARIVQETYALGSALSWTSKAMALTRTFDAKGSRAQRTEPAGCICLVAAVGGGAASAMVADDAMAASNRDRAAQPRPRV